MIPKSRCQLCVAIAPTKRRYTLSHTLFVDCNNTRPYTSTISTSYAKQQIETYLQLDCGLAESNAPAKHPILFHRSRLLCPLSPCRRAASAKRNVPVMSSATATRGRQLISSAYFLGNAPSKYPVELLLASSSITKRRSGGAGRYLLVIMRAGGIGVREIGLCGACDQDLGASKGAQLTIWPISRATLSCRNRCAALSSLYDLATTMSRCQRSAPPVTDSMFSLQGVLCGRFF